MKLHKLTGYIQQIYLVEYDHGLMLMDGCSRADVTLISRYIIDTLQRPLSDLKLIVVTHMHPDHAGAAHRLRQLSGCRLVCGQFRRHWYGGIDGLLMYLTDVLLTLYVARRLRKSPRWLWYSPYLRPDLRLQDGDRLPGFEEWQVINTPGHTSHDISLWHELTGRLYIADVVVRAKGRYIAPFPIFHPNKYRHTLERIRQLAPKRLLLAHGGELEVSTDHPAMNIFTPDKPRTHWRAFKYRLLRMLLRAE